MSAIMSPLSLVKAKYQTFLAVPKKYRPDGLKTTRDFADHFGIPTGMLLSWEQEPGFITDVFMQSRAIIVRDMADIIEALVERSKQGSVTAIKLALEVAGVHHDTVEVQHTKGQDQLILILPDGMDIPNLPKVGQLPSGLEDGTVIEGQVHIDSDMEFVLGASGDEEELVGNVRTTPRFDVDDEI